jgi:hypothetical protein
MPDKLLSITRVRWPKDTMMQMQTKLAFLACGSPFSGPEALLLLVAFASLLLGALFTVCNLVMICVLYHRGHFVGLHLLGSFTCVGLAVLIIFGMLENFRFAATAIIAIGVIVIVHFVALIATLRQTRPPKTEQHDVPTLQKETSDATS